MTRELATKTISKPIGEVLPFMIRNDDGSVEEVLEDGTKNTWNTLSTIQFHALAHEKGYKYLHRRS